MSLRGQTDQSRAPTATPTAVVPLDRAGRRFDEAPGREAASPTEYRILGPLEIVRGRCLVRLGATKERALVALLALEAGRVVADDRLVEALWGEAPPASARASLRVLVSRLRRALAPAGAGEAIVRRPPGYVLVAEPHQVDASLFEALLARGRQEQAAGDPWAASETLAAALGLWRGPALADVLEGPATHAEAARLEDTRVTAIECRLEAELACGRHDALTGELKALVTQHPYRERLCAARMLALYRSGRQSEALIAYRDLRSRLVEELGIEPSPELRELERAILAQDPGLSLVAPGSAVAAGRLRAAAEAATPEASGPVLTARAPHRRERAASGIRPSFGR